MPSSKTKIHRSLFGKWRTREITAHGWVSGDNRAKTWTYWWLEIERGKVSKAAYEVRRDGEVVVERTPLVKSPKVFAKTGYIDEEPDPPGHGPIGGTAKLDAGIYDLDFFLKLGGVEHVLQGIRFEVADRKAKEGGWQILPKEKSKS